MPMKPDIGRSSGSGSGGTTGGPGSTTGSGSLRSACAGAAVAASSPAGIGFFRKSKLHPGLQKRHPK